MGVSNGLGQTPSNDRQAGGNEEFIQGGERFTPLEAFPKVG